jgi:D-3-phosphoglycerate dehydrogenase
MLKQRLLYYDILKYHPEASKIMHENFEVVSLLDPDHDTEVVLQNIDILMAPLGYQVDSKKIDQCPNLKIIASSTLSVPHIDMAYSNSKGIKVCYLGDQREFLKTITPTAEFTVGLIIAITRRIPWAHKAACSGTWNGRSFGRRTPRMLSNMTLGIVGLGRLGSLVASYGAALGLKAFFYSPKSENHKYTRCSNLLELAKRSDIVSIHCHLTRETEKLVDREFIQNMKPGSYIVNTARGEIIDENALLEGLKSGHLAGAALDVLADEYQPNFKSELKNLPLVQYARSNDNLIITPHYAGATADAWFKTQSKTLELVLNELNK